MLDHGGKLNDAVQGYGRKREEWLDLSTGINPCPYPVPILSPTIWHRLPEASEALLQVAKDYYGATQLLAVAGSQAAIQGLPRLRSASNVVIAAPSYAEHAYAWRQAGHRVREVAYDQLEDFINGSTEFSLDPNLKVASTADLNTSLNANLNHDACDVLVLCNPNNPTAERIAPQRLLAWADKLAQRGGWLIVDEAFCDMTPELSVIASASASASASAVATTHKGLIVLRSVGKFFGLAGLRLGFVAAEEKLLTQLADFLGPWAVTTATQEIATAALSDTAWQTIMRKQLDEQGERLHNLLAAHDIHASGCALFQYWQQENAIQATQFSEHMAQQGIWVRQFSHGVRLGLPPDEDGWGRLQHALEKWKNSDDKK